MKLLKGFQSVVLLLVVLSFLLMLYNYILKLWREGFGNLGAMPPPTPSLGDAPKETGAKGVPCGALTCRVGSRCAGGPGNYHCVPEGTDHHQDDHSYGTYGHAAHEDTYGIHRQNKLNCRKPKHGITENGQPHGWNKECIVPPGVTYDNPGMPAYKLCGGRLDEQQKENGHSSTDCRKRWKVTSRGDVSLETPSMHGYTHGHHKHTSNEIPRRIRDNGNHRYKQWIPDHLDKTHISQSDYEKIGKRFIANEARSRNIQAPPVLDSEAEVLGRLVWRVYMAEIEQKRANSPKSQEELIDRETNLLDKVSQIMRLHTDYASSNKCASIIQCAKEVNSKYLSNNYTHGRTTNMYGHHHEEPIQRKTGYAFEGRPLHGSPAYSDANSAIAHCKEDRNCGGINYNTHTRRYELMPKDAHLVKHRGMVAYIKNQGHSAWKKHCHSEHGYHDDSYHHDRSYHGNEYDHQRKEDSWQHHRRGQTSWSPRNPNLKPKPYNSLMDLFR